MTVALRTPARASRWHGAFAGLVPVLAIVLLFAISGTGAQSADVAVSIGLVALIATAAGWLAGPVAAAEPRRLPAAALAYAIALLAMNAWLAVVQAAADSIATHGLDVFAVLTAVIGRGAVALISTAYLILPAIGAGLAWSVAARSLMRLGGSRR